MLAERQPFVRPRLCKGGDPQFVECQPERIGRPCPKSQCCHRSHPCYAANMIHVLYMSARPARRNCFKIQQLRTSILRLKIRRSWETPRRALPLHDRPCGKGWRAARGLDSHDMVIPGLRFGSQGSMDARFIAARQDHLRNRGGAKQGIARMRRKVLALLAMLCCQTAFTDERRRHVAETA